MILAVDKWLLTFFASHKKLSRRGDIDCLDCRASEQQGACLQHALKQRVPLYAFVFRLAAPADCEGLR